jgi:gliding motility-associated-like protein
VNQAYPSHIVGGELFYTYISEGTQPNTSKYKVTLRLFTFCSCGTIETGICLPNLLRVNIFINTPFYALEKSMSVKKDEQSQINLTNLPPCVTNPPAICYQVNTYSNTVELVNNNQGYIFSFSDCCRTRVFNAYNTPANGIGLNGSTYTAILPGKNRLPVGNNSTAVVELNDAALICYKSKFELKFTANDPEGDSLAYILQDAYDGKFNNRDTINYPPYKSIEYNSPFFTGLIPLGDRATIDSKTGVISGYAPYVTGKAIVNVIILEYRKGVYIAEHRKDFIVRVDECEIPTAYLSPKATVCDKFDVEFKNDGSDLNVVTWLWNFGDVASGANNISTSQNPTHTFSSAGNFTVKLYLNKGLSCEDSTELVVKVYPGFKPANTYEGVCVNQPVQFKDLTVHDFGTINKWIWNFGDPVSGVNNQSFLKNPTHIYRQPGTYKTQLIVQSDKGCTAFIDDSIEIKAGPALNVFPSDTLICTIDTLQIKATGVGAGLKWQPNYMIDNVNSYAPLVSPDITTTYTATLTNDIGCATSKNVVVNVVDKVTQGNDYDTTICATDPILLKLNSNALYYSWLPNDGSLNNSSIKNPIATPLFSTNYVVVGKISDKCFAQNTIKVTAIPYPKPIAPDVNVCLGNSTQLSATGGSFYNWSPRAFLNNTIIANPRVINPTSNVFYTLTVRDTLGCPKPVQKIVKLNVIKIKALINTKDTNVVINQPLQLIATGSTNYEWLPDNRWLSNTAISNPIALPKNDIVYTVKVSDVNGCFDIATAKIKVFNVLPDLYLPNVFTPNGDNKNDFFKPIPLGIKSVDLFQIYNRWGQLIYNSTNLQKGWDGTFGGNTQEPTTYIWIAEATDYTGKKIKKRGSVILMR